MKLKNLVRILPLQLMVILLAFSGVFVKLASTSWNENGLFSINTFFFIGCYLFFLAIYAFFWQRVIRNVPLSTAYLNKSLSLIWSLLWGVLFFGDTIGIQNVIGAAVIIVGIILVTVDG